ncbi:hypothetical protein CC86DRAFT_472305 [Ophiobolus disseminans]|uniref:F-box domain-containing protein n=1 Tax=Ophiobolus disseminans TaxID=1469910 RepID=A0A6A6ZG32_9PLEO|nr:hypothetical protein CC86DRAFT_472305 [Ophiobolus disseminans]
MALINPASASASYIAQPRLEYTRQFRAMRPGHNPPSYPSGGFQRALNPSINQSASASRQPAFPFLALPKELRLMIYEALFPVRHHDNVKVPASKNKCTTITLITPLLRPVSPPITRTCRSIHAEVSALLRSRFKNTHLYQHSIPRLIIPAKHAARLVKYNGVVDEVLNCLHYVGMISRQGANHVDACFILKDLLERNNAFNMPLHTASAFADALARFAGAGGTHVKTHNYECALTYSSVNPWTMAYFDVGHLGVEILVQGDGGACDVQLLLDRLEKRGGEYEVEIDVLHKAEGGGGEAQARRRWVGDKGVVGREVWGEYWG